MRFFAHLSIKRKLTLIAMLTSGVALLAACAMFMAFDVVTCRHEMIKNVRMHAAIVGSNSTAALSFNDGNDARQTLTSLRADPHVVDACVFAADGKVFATYNRDGTAQPHCPADLLADAHRFVDQHLEVFQPILLEGKVIGTVFVRSDLQELYARIRRYSVTLGGVALAAAGLAFFLAARLQRFISRPIQHLADTARAVSADKDYTVRALKTANDELGQLTDGFNDMLEQIQVRDAGLKAHQDHLEELVEHRTEQLQKVNEDLTAARDRAEAASRAKSNFLANMSHEIRTPMTAIVGYSDLMLEPSQTLSDRQDCLQIIRRNGRHLMALINDILDISKIEAGKMTVERIPCDLPSLVVDVASLMRPRAVDKGLDFRLLFDGPIPQQVTTDALRVKQILMNLLGNAIKFTSAGVIALKVECAPLPGQDESELRFAITDTGVGMTPEQISRLFQPFTQADESMTRKFGGTGLGLTISQRLARLLGGDIAVRAELGVGSTFTVTLRGGSLADATMLTEVNEAVLALTPAQTAQQAVDLHGRILLAEDGLDNQKLISLHLRKAGAEVVIADDGRIAVDLMKAQPFDLIIMDMQMPELDGYGAASELRKRGYTLPIIALTAHAMAEDRGRCLQAGCTDYLTKPIDKQLLLATVHDHLTRARAAGAPAAQGTTPSPKGANDLPSPATATPVAGGERSRTGEGRGEGSSAPAPAPAPAPTPTDLPDVLASTFATDPDMQDVIREFVDRLPGQVARMLQLLESHNLDELRRAVHQMKGAGGGYGFAQLTQLAARAEQTVKDGGSLDSIAQQVDNLIRLIRRVQGYDPRREDGASNPVA